MNASTEHRARPTLSLPPSLCAGLIILLTLAAFWPAMRAGFIWDDDRYVTANPLVQSNDGLSRIWFSSEPMDYYPVTFSSFWLEWRLWEHRPAGYHAVNVLLHAACALILWLLLRRLRIPGAWLAALLFAVHPINVETVAWISQRKNTLGMLFFLLTAMGYQDWHRTGRFGSYAGALLLFALSLMSKPLAVMFPFMIVAYDWWRNPRRLARGVAAAVPFLLVAVLYGMMTVIFQATHSIQGEAVGPATVAGRLLVPGRALLFYAAKTVWPFGLSPVYPEWHMDQFSAATVLPTLAVVLLAVLFLLNLSRWGRPALFALVFFVLMLFPVLGIFDVGFMFYSMVADHWVYPALPALFVPFAYGVAKMHRRGPGLRWMLTVGATALVLFLGVLSYRQCRIYENKKTLFTHTVERNPSAWVAHLWLGNLAFSDRDLVEAEARYREALRLRPGYWEAQNGLGIVHAVRGELDEAIDLFRQVLARKPEHANAKRNLAIALGEKGRSDRSSVTGDQ
ncbi:MAG: tetratricopeptide repeat protein [Lentisphaerae bacterium]|nr:tetratricopeptide repeat protein [Lentisphaerota bacterium]